jgi:hypothetical protein
MKGLMKYAAMLLITFLPAMAIGQDHSWVVEATKIDPSNYYGVTVANGMVGLVSSAEPMKVKDVVLNGVYDYYQRGRVSNILKTFNHINMNLDVDGQRVGPRDIQNYKQVLDMKKASLTTSFDVGDKLTVKHTIMALRHLPFTAMAIIEFKSKKNVRVVPMSVIEAPNHLTDVRNLYSEIDRPHVVIPLLTSVGKSPSGKHTVAASNSIIFSEPHGKEPDLIHEDWDYNMHLMKFTKDMKAGESYSFSVVASATSTEHFDDPLNEAERLTIFAKLEGRSCGRVTLLLKVIFRRRKTSGSDCTICIHLQEPAQLTVCLQWVYQDSVITDTSFGIRSCGCIRHCWLYNLISRSLFLNIVSSDWVPQNKTLFHMDTKEPCFPGNHLMKERKILPCGHSPDHFNITSQVV